MCRSILALENEYLALCRVYVLTQLRVGEEAERWEAARILRSVLYRDGEIAAALASLGADTDEEVRGEGAKAVEALRR